MAKEAGKSGRRESFRNHCAPTVVEEDVEAGPAYALVRGRTRSYLATYLPQHDSQVWTHLRHASAQLSITASPSAMLSQQSAHALQSAAHAAHTGPQCLEPRRQKFAHVWQISAQSCIRRMWSGVACLPPLVRQCWMHASHALWQSMQLGIQLLQCADAFDMMLGEGEVEVRAEWRNDQILQNGWLQGRMGG
jgi:hypothetical protein